VIRVTAVWMSVAPAGARSLADLERFTLTALDGLALDVDHVVHHVVARSRPAGDTAGSTAGRTAGSTAGDTSSGSTGVAALRIRRGGVPGTVALDPAEVAAGVFRRVGGTVTVLPAVDGGAAPIVVGDPGPAAACLAAATASRDGLSGRCVRFPGQDRLTRVVPVHRIVERSAISRVAGDGRPVADDELVHIRSQVQPTFEAGELVLRVAASH